MKLQIKNAEYYQLEKGKEIVLFDDFKEAVKEMKEAIKKANPEGVKLWRVKKESGKWAMIEVGYQELTEISFCSTCSIHCFLAFLSFILVILSKVLIFNFFPLSISEYID